ncbi:MerR family transcriptional regulator [Sedimentitalea sp. HM32M-2]|uniref:MerR family transcriptional regulator n=1 Tax=Sedimentitalea sp. HM32M-2 TaxID=3351566 RepID=UPI00362C1656
MSKSPDAFRTISEVADWLGVQAHVLRFWESKFSQIKPVKRAGGRRYYRPNDMRLLGGIKKLLHEDGLTIKGAQKILKEQGVGHVAEMSQSLEEIDDTAATTGPALRAVPTAAKPVAFADLDDDFGEEDDSPGGDLFSAAAVPAPTTGDGNPAPRPPDDAAAPSAPQASQSGSTASAGAPAFMHRPAPQSASDAASRQAAQQSETAAPTPAAAPETVPPSGLEPVQAEPAQTAPAAPQPSASGQSETEPEPPRARVVDAPDPPSEARLPYSPGVLAQLAMLDRVTTEQSEQLAPLVQDLRNWLATKAGPGAT